MGVTFGQTKPKQNSGEKPSAGKETDAAMKEIQKAMEGMSPEGLSDLYVKENTTLDMAATMEAEFDQSSDERKGLWKKQQ
jgi:hypothetical protein